MEAADAGGHDTTAADDHALGAQAARLLRLVPGDEAPVRGHDPPPRHRLGRDGEDAADRPGPTGEPGVLGHVAVADHLARGQRPEHVQHAVLEVAHAPAPASPAAFSMAVAS